LRVLQICPLWYAVHDDAPGGVETLLPRIIGALIDLGCEVTTLATADSRVAGELIPAAPSGLVAQMAAGTVAEHYYYEQHLIRLALRHAPRFDIIHSHIGPAAYALSGVADLGSRVLHTQHTPVLADLQWFAGHYPDVWFSTVSEFQAAKLRATGSRRVRVVHNGIRIEDFRFSPVAGRSLLFIGRMEHVKGPDIAIRVARATDRPLVLAGPILQPDYFKERIQPFLDDQIRYVGVVDHAKKNELFGEAACTVLPFRGEEPFGLVSIESMACGTPVVTLPNGALPEIVDHGRSGYIARTEDELAPFVERSISLDRAEVRQTACKRFDISTVAQAYCRLYSDMVTSKEATCVS
jgi:glycosyltransferase involved in cell wall biosynthesis